MKKSKILIVALVGLLLAVGVILTSCGGCKGDCGFLGCNDKCPQTSEGCSKETC